MRFLLAVMLCILMFLSAFTTDAAAQACPKGYRKNSLGNCCKIAKNYKGCVASCTQCGGSNCSSFCRRHFKN